jgi:hypothetical protein
MRTVSINIFRDNAVGPTLYRIDYGTKIQLTGIDIDGTYEVHFGKNLSDDAYRVLGDETGVVVPDILLQTDGTLYGWLYVHTGADDGWTKRSFAFRVKNRPNYTPAEPTPVQQDIIEQSIAALNVGVDSVNEALDTVQQTVDDALQAAKDSGEFDGKDGYTPIKGVDYFDGKDGYTPIKGVDYSDGEDGYTPIKGVDYFDGEPGKPGDDGISPTVTVTDITGGHRVTITDAEGPHSFDVMDGPEGAPGVGVPSGGTTGQVLSKASGTDYDTEWVDKDSVDKRVTPIENAVLSDSTFEVVGIPEYVSDITAYGRYGITETGWYTFARIKAKDGVAVTENTTVTGAAGYIAEAGADHVDVAVRFGVAAESQAVTVSWGDDTTDTAIFKATDLAVRNLDYKVTFYIYDIAKYATWSYALTTDETFAADKKYYTEADGVYTLAEVTAGEAVPADTYYTHSKLHFEGMTRNVTYKLDEIVDCPIEITLPEVEDDSYGAWFEIQMRYNGSYSCTLLPPEGVKIGTVSTQNQTAGVNTIDLQYTGVGGVRMWSLLNTHSNVPA